MRLVLLESELLIWIAENEEICKYSLLHGINDTTILYLEPMELMFISMYTVGFTFVCIKLYYYSIVQRLCLYQVFIVKYTF